MHHKTRLLTLCRSTHIKHSEHCGHSTAHNSHADQGKSLLQLWISVNAWFSIYWVRLLSQIMDIFLQGYMSGKDFARSVVCSVHTNQIEEYLAKVDALPDKLIDAKVPAPGHRSTVADGIGLSAGICFFCSINVYWCVELASTFVSNLSSPPFMDVCVIALSVMSVCSSLCIHCP